MTSPSEHPDAEHDAPRQLPDTIRIGHCDTGQPACGQPARWTVAGWRCHPHRPTSHRHD